MTDACGANTFLVRKYNSRTFHLKFVDHAFFRFFRSFPRINVGGDSARFPSLEDALVSLASPSRQRVGCDNDETFNCYEVFQNSGLTEFMSLKLPHFPEFVRVFYNNLKI